jgi:hypothetical protein
MGWMFWYAGRYEDAITQWQRMAAIEKDQERLELENRGMAAFRHGGRAAYARLKLDAIRTGLWSHADTDFDLAEWSMYAGDYDAAISALRARVNKRDSTAMEIAVNPVYDELHQDPRFQELLDMVFGASGAKEIRDRLASQHRDGTYDTSASILPSTNRADGHRAQKP